MTSALGVEQSRRRRLHTCYCSCGSHLMTTEKIHLRAVACNDADSAFHCVDCVIGGPLIFVLMFALIGPDWAIIVSVLAVLVLGMHSIDTTLRVWHHHGVPDSNRGYRWFGRLVLLFAVLSALAYSVPGEKYQEWAALADSPKPSDCYWATLPLGDKHCHYEPIFHHVNEPGQDITVKWYRVDD